MRASKLSRYSWTMFDFANQPFYTLIMTFVFSVYFTDVFEENDGAHIYIPKTHRKKNINNILTSRFKTSEINKNYNAKKVFLGKSGTTFMVDTFGIHKGSPVKKGTRMALILEFGREHFPTQKECWYI